MDFLYLYDESDFSFIETREVELDYFGEEVRYGNDTKIMPPEFGNQQIPVFDLIGQTWLIVEDHRGKEGYVNNGWSKIKELGALPEGWTDEYDDIPKTLEEIKLRKIAGINLARNEKEVKGFVFDGSFFDTDEKSYLRLLGASQSASLALANGQEFSIDWTLADNTSRLMTGQEMINIIPTFTLYANGLHEISRTLKEQVSNAQSILEVEGIVIDFSDNVLL